MIETTILDADGIACFKVVGPLYLPEILAVIKKVYPSVKHGVVWDFSESDPSQVTKHDMMLAAQSVATYAKHRKTAAVGSADLQFGLLRMYEAYAEIERVSPIMRVFRNTDDALDWLRE